jgi:cytochrome c-type biogenesis protein CcmH/NrfF
MNRSAYVVIVVMTASVATSAFAQTDPSIIMRIQPPAQIDYGAIALQAQAIRAARARNEALRQREADVARAHDLQLSVGDAIAQGHCDAAKRLALEGADFDLAERVMKLCVGDPVAPKP